MFDWLGLSPASTQVVGWVMIVIAGLALGLLLFWVVVNIRNWLKYERSVKVINHCQNQIDLIEETRGQNGKARRAGKLQKK